MRTPMPLRAAAWCLSTTALAACAPAPAPAHAQAPAAAPADTARPLAEFASRPLALVPVQLLGSGDSLGFAAQVNNAGAFLASIDDEIAFALSQRRTARQWQMPPVLARRMRSNGPYGVDVHDMGAGPLRDPKLKGDLPLPDPLASNLRSLVALGGEARYVLIPVEVTFAGAKGAGRAVLKLVLVDARSARLVWVGVVATDPVARVTPAIPAMLGARVADLVTAP